MTREETQRLREKYRALFPESTDSEECTRLAYQRESRHQQYQLERKREEEEREARRKARQEEGKKRQEWEMMCQYSCYLFLKGSGWIQQDPKGSISSRRLYELYEQWCLENRIPPRTIRILSSEIKHNPGMYGTFYTENLPLPGGGHTRGFRGIREAAATANTDHTE